MWPILYPLVCLLGADPGAGPLSLESLQPAPTVSVADVVAGYRANAALFKRSRITWCQIEQRLPAWYEARKLMDAYLRQVNGRDVNSPADQLPAEFWQWRDYWTDGERQQLRTPCGLSIYAASGPGWKFPDDPLTADALRTTYTDYSIKSIDPKGEFVWRWWFGARGSSHGTCTVSAMPMAIETALGITMFPPLLAPDNLNREDAAHPLDRFFRLPQDEMRILGSLEIDGVPVYVVEHRKDEEVWEEATERGIKCGATERAFVDPARGYIPLRIERGMVRIHDGQDVDRQPVIGVVVKCTKIERVPGGGFYPTEGANQEFDMDPANPRFTEYLNAGTFYYGTEPHPPKVQVTDDLWKATRVEVNPAMPEAMFDFEFPMGTELVNSDTGDIHEVGIADVFRHPTRRWTLAAIAAAIVAVVVAVIARRGRAEVRPA